MSHFNAHDSFKTRKSIEKKQRNLDKKAQRRREFEVTFFIESGNNYGIVLEVKYDNVYVFYHDEIILTTFDKKIGMNCNNLLYPGDKVIIKEKNGIYVITNVIVRSSVLSRTKKDSARINSVGIDKIIATNVDLAIIVVAAKEPPLHPKFIDRYLMLLQNSNIDAVICLNKSDLKTEKDDVILDVYRRIGIPVIETSTYNNMGILDLKCYLDGKQAILVGNSGVGKSSLINAIMGNNNTKTGNISSKSNRGRHTTTSSKYYILNNTTSIIDTPGIRSLDVSSFELGDVQNYFTEILSVNSECKYNDCLHVQEPVESCAVKRAVNQGLIDRNRYESYLRIVNDILKEKNVR